ncbi:MAG: hypothetical protein JNG89_11615 [Planctomycetaceae bacterium]|nr:hypothetical protein [Planctomycetaceae bacterium]
MTRSPITLPTTEWLRKARSWFGVLLMVVSLFGGYRATTRVTEETETQQTSEILEYAHRLAEGGQRTPNRRARTADVPPRLAAAVDGSSRSVLSQRAHAELPSIDHVLANGLRAPLRC